MRFVFLTFILLLAISTLGQITGTGCVGETVYTNGAPNDSIYYYPDGILGELTATPISGVGPFDFVWAFFTPEAGAWSGFLTENDVATSTIANLLPGAYSVNIYDSNGNDAGCEQVWIVQHYFEGESGSMVFDIEPIPPSCSSIVLNATIYFDPPWSTGMTTGYSNLPTNPLLIDSQTTISVCFSGTHTWVSDLGFYIIGPPSCGSPTLVLSPNPGSIGQGPVCNMGDNISNLCFSTESTNNLNVCAGSSPLSGTYGTYGATPTAINWSDLYGCDASSGGWSVQIYDCIAGDVGTLTDATISFSGINSCGGLQSQSYTTPAGFSSFIADNSCSPSSASIFTVPPGTNFTPITCDLGYEWTNSLDFFMPDAIGSLEGVTFPYSISLTIDILWTDSTMTSTYPMQDIVFYLNPIVDCTPGTPGAPGDELEGESCLPSVTMMITPGVASFDYIEPQSVIIPPLGPVCMDNGPFQLPLMNVPGTWSGNGITDPLIGIFDPAVAGPGTFDLMYSPSAICYFPGFGTIDVAINYTNSILDPGPLCENDAPINLQGSNIGIWIGNGITDMNNGTFDPAVAGPGLHFIELSSFANCSSTGSIFIEVNQAPQLSISLNSVVCSGASTILNASGADFYEWSPATYLNDPFSPNPTSTPANSITYTVVGTNMFDCTATDNVTLTLVPMPEVNTGVDQFVCPGSVVPLLAVGTVGSYSWQPAIGIINANTPNASTIAVNTTTYTVTLTDACGLTATDQLDVTVFDTELVNAGTDIFFCDGETATLNGLTTAINPDITWSSTEGVVSSQLENQLQGSVDVSGTYLLSIVTSDGCTFTDEIEVTEVPYPVLTVTADADVCNNTPYQLNASGAQNYSWTPANLLNNAAISNPQATINQPTVFTVTGTSIYGCSSTEDVSLGVIPQPSVSAESVDPVCPGTSVALSATGTDGDFQWSPSAGIQNPSNQNATASPLITTVYTVTLTDQCLTQVTDEILVTVDGAVVLSAGADVQFCEDVSAQLTAVVTGNYISTLWTTVDGVIASGEENQLSITTNTTGNYLITVETALGCMYSDQVQAIEVALPVFNLPTPQEFCPGQTLTLTVGNNWDVVVWNNTSYTNELIVDESGLYSVIVTENGCSTEAFVDVLEIEMPVVELGPDVTICSGEEVIFTIPAMGIWNTGANNNSITVNTGGTYSVTVHQGFCSVTDSTTVYILPLPFLNMPSSVVGCLNQPYYLSAFQPVNSNYFWSTGETTEVITVTEFGTYSVVASNSCGSVSAVVSVTFEDCSFAIYIPNSFTPDNDGVNDVWKIESFNLKTISLSMFNRWGEVVFFADSPDAVWTGSVNGGKYFANDEVYFYKMDFESVHGEVGTRSGHVVLVR